MNEHPDSLHRSIEAAKSLRLELARMLAGQDGELSQDDLETLQDSFDGETTLDREIRNAMLSIEEDELFVTGCKAREAELKARRSRLEKRIEVTRGLIEQAMTIAKWPTHKMDIGTVSLGNAAPRVEIDNESEVPSQFFKRADPTLDRAGLGKVLKERHRAMEAASAIKDADDRAAAVLRVNLEYPSIPGCHLETGGFNLSIRRS